MLCGYVLMILGLVPGFPKLQIYALATVLVLLGMREQKKKKKQEEVPPPPAAQAEQAAEEKRKPENVLNLLQVEPMSASVFRRRS